MFGHKIKSNSIVILCLALSLMSCGGGKQNQNKPDHVEPEPLLISGVAALGAIKNGQVTIYDFSNGSKGNKITSTNKPTDPDGSYSFLIGSLGSPLILLCVSGGSYEEPASQEKTDTAGVVTPKVTVDLNTNDSLCAVTHYQSEKSKNISITYFTHLAYALALNKIKKKVELNEAVTQANLEISTWLGFDIINTRPADITNSDTTSNTFDDSMKYGFANAGLSLLMSSITNGSYKNANSLMLSQLAFDDIKADGLLNGRTSSTDLLTLDSKRLSRLLYRDNLAENILGIGNSSNNITTIKSSDAELAQYRDKLKNYTGMLFKVPGNNNLPTAVDDTAQVNIGSSVVIDVLANDFDRYNEVLTVELLQDLAFVIRPGSATVNADNTITYRANPSTPAGTSDSFRYRIYDGYDYSKTPAVVSISIVDGKNKIPVANDDLITIGKGSTRAIAVLANDTDAENNALTVQIITPPSNALNSVTVVDGVINFTAGILGQESFTYVANDGFEDSLPATVTVDVITELNLAPIAVDDSAEVVFGKFVTINVLANDYDPNGDTLTAKRIVFPEQPGLQGAVPALYYIQLNPDNTFTFYPPTQARSIIGTTIFFNYDAYDGQLKSETSGVISILVTTDVTEAVK